MGVTYKLRPEVKDFIIEQKKANPSLSCRSLATLVGQKFQFHISKSSINAIFKEAGLSMPVGRRSKTKKVKPKPPVTQESSALKLLTAQTVSAPQLPPKEEMLPPASVPPVKQEEETPPPAAVREEAKIEEVFQELPAKMSLKKTADISTLQETVPDLAGFRPMKVPKPEPEKEIPPAEIVLPPVAAIEEIPQKVVEKKTETSIAPVQQVPEEKIPIEPTTPAATPVEEIRKEETKKDAGPPIEIAPEEKPVPAIFSETQPAAPAQQVPNETPVPAPQESAKPLPTQKPPGQTQPETEPTGVPQEIACTGALLFKAVDYLLGGIQGVIDKIKVRLDKPEAGLEEKVASAVYSNTFSLPEELLFLTGKVFPQGEIEGYIDSLQANVTSAWDLVRALLNALDEIRSIKVSISDGSSLFLDGQLLTVWNTNQIPHDFNNPLRNTKRSINKYFYENAPLILLAANGTETPPKDFFNFLLALNQHAKSITKLTLCGNDGEELEVNSFEQPKKINFLFGLWPHQFIQHRKVKKIGEFNPVFIPSLNKEVYAAECAIELEEPTLKQSMLLRGCAVKNTASEKMRYLVVGNASSEELVTPELLDRYLSRWPQPDYAYQDANRKIEMFTYTAGGHYVWPGTILNVDKNQPSVAVRKLFDNYVKTIDFYIRRTLLPNGYQDKAFSFMREQFYSLPVKIRLHETHSTVLFYPPPGYRLRADLVYLCRKLNEREIVFPNTKRLLFSL